MSGIEIPPAAYTAAIDAALEAAAPLIVAAHLRRIADRIAITLPDSRKAQAALRAEADRLDGGAS